MSLINIMLVLINHLRDRWWKQIKISFVRTQTCYCQYVHTYLRTHGLSEPYWKKFLLDHCFRKHYWNILKYYPRTQKIAFGLRHLFSFSKYWLHRSYWVQSTVFIRHHFCSNLHDPAGNFPVKNKMLCF